MMEGVVSARVPESVKRYLERVAVAEGVSVSALLNIPINAIIEADKVGTPWRRFYAAIIAYMEALPAGFERTITLKEWEEETEEGERRKVMLVLELSKPNEFSEIWAVKLIRVWKYLDGRFKEYTYDKRVWGMEKIYDAGEEKIYVEGLLDEALIDLIAEALNLSIH